MDDVAQNACHLLAGRPLAGMVQGQDRLAGGALEDQHRLEAMSARVGVEQRELLLSVHHIVGIIDIENDAVRGLLVAPAEEIDQAASDAVEGCAVRNVLQSRERWLAHQIHAGLRVAATGDLHRRIGAQRVGVIAVLVSSRDQDHADKRHVGVGVGDAQGIADIRQRQRDHLRNAELQRDLAQHDDATVRRQVAAIERGCERLARNG